MTALRRFLVFQALLLWQGGFLFYAAFVVPAGTEVLGSTAAQGAVTTRVADALNLCGVIGLAAVAWDLSLTRDPAARRTAARWWCWGVAVGCQCLLFVFHELLDSYMDPGRRYIVVIPPFRPVHRTYLWVSTVQWVACLLLAWWTLRAWAGESEVTRREVPSPKSETNLPSGI
ncbi:MAG: hypothetical protein JWO38_2381 [Gemmataceae bacterium]|nr:hypothetical protein [Gemmataceae bacterium]